MRSAEDFDSAWEQARRDKRRTLAAGGAIVAALFAVSAWRSELDPVRLAEGLPGIVDYLRQTIPALRSAADLREWFWGLDRWLLLLAETLAIAFLATLLGTAVAALLSFSAARNLARSRWERTLTRRALELARTVPVLVFALIFVVAFGGGPLAGVLALAVHSAGSLGKLFSEVNENAGMGPVDSLRATGAGWAQTARYAVLPQSLPSFLSYSMLRFEINVRSASVIGFVGVGGIGQELYYAIRQFLYHDVGAILALIVLTVTAIDLVGEKLRGLVSDGGAIAP
ncbi:MAG: phosphonate ABC transporter, permease protein PhnE [Acidobacteria bacterium]|nr:phosphonate ABC transporter, permease protein PhnE [Acidobacteriota bacterium]